MDTTDLVRAPARLAQASLTTASRAGGAALATTVQALGALRNTAKPLHPRGRYVHATLTRFGSAVPAGVPWLDDRGTHQAVVRLSRAVGLPAGWPDIHGIAIRVDDEERQADLLFATTGLGRLTRFTLTASLTTGGRPYTTLLPYRGPSGPILLALEETSPTAMMLLWAHGPGTWHPFATLDLEEPYDGPALSFDPMLKSLADLPPYNWVRALRLPAYRAARRGRADDS